MAHRYCVDIDVQCTNEISLATIIKMLHMKYRVKYRQTVQDQRIIIYEFLFYSEEIKVQITEKKLNFI